MGRQEMDLAQEASTAGPGFKVVCDACGSLSIKLADPIKISSAAVIRCGRCDTVRGTLDELHSLARASKDVFEF